MRGGLWVASPHLSPVPPAEQRDSDAKLVPAARPKASKEGN
jgi:hypothetical protein